MSGVYFCVTLYMRCIMKSVKLVVPSVSDLWYRERCMSDPDTMSYNAGYDVSYEGYHYDTGCIDFDKSRWETWYDAKMPNPNFYYAYILDTDTREYVGYLNFNLNTDTKHATMGIVVESKYRGRGYMRPALLSMIEVAKAKGVEVLTDTVPENRTSALKVFYELGFKVVNQYAGTKFGKEELVNEIHLEIK